MEVSWPGPPLRPLGPSPTGVLAPAEHRLPRIPSPLASAHAVPSARNSLGPVHSVDTWEACPPLP